MDMSSVEFQTWPGMEMHPLTPALGGEARRAVHPPSQLCRSVRLLYHARLRVMVSLSVVDQSNIKDKGFILVCTLVARFLVQKSRLQELKAAAHITEMDESLFSSLSPFYLVQDPTLGDVASHSGRSSYLSYLNQGTRYSFLHRFAQRLNSQVMLDLIKLTVEINHLIWR